MSDKEDDLGGLKNIGNCEYFETIALERLQEIERLEGECERLRGEVDNAYEFIRSAKNIIHIVSDERCSECFPDNTTNIESFVCVYHKALKQLTEPG